jgi:hypothetical protein
MVLLLIAGQGSLLQVCCRYLATTVAATTAANLAGVTESAVDSAVLQSDFAVKTVIGAMTSMVLCRAHSWCSGYNRVCMMARLWASVGEYAARWGTSTK